MGLALFIRKNTKMLHLCFYSRVVHKWGFWHSDLELYKTAEPVYLLVVQSVIYAEGVHVKLLHVIKLEFDKYVTDYMRIKNKMN